MRKYSKILLVGGAMAALAVPSVALADQPANPGGFGRERAANIETFFTNDGLGGWGNPIDGVEGASDRAGDNGTINQDWRAANPGFMPTH
jgi:hypothetical protein